ncbi:MAG: MATE family efflux transporter [Clostridia bacterium]|nr:MATE family efflux transporter [Clostridia bacterium]
MDQDLQIKKFEKMTTAPVKGLVVKLAIPTMISMLVTTLYNLADTYFVGQLGDVDATAAVTASYALMNIIQALGFLFGQGSGNYISRALGQKDYEKCRRMASTAFFSAVFVGLMVLLFGTLFLEPLASFSSATDSQRALDFSKEYMQIILMGAPVMCASIVLNNQLRFQGNANFAMIGLLSGAVLNVFLDALLVPKLEVAGAAIATVSCQTTSFIVLLICTRIFSDNVRITPKAFSFKLFYYKEIVRGGLPSLCRQGVASVMSVALMHCCYMVESAEMTAEAVKAAFGIVSKVMMLISSMMIGFGQGFQPVCGFNYGAKKYDRVLEAFRFCVIVSLVFLLSMAVIFYFFCPQVLAFIQKSGEDGQGQAAVDLAVSIMRRQLLSLPLMSLVVMSNMLLQTTGRVVGASILAMARQGLMLIPAMYLLSLLFGMSGLIWAQPVADTLSLIISLPFLWHAISFMKKELKKGGSEVL